LTTNYIDTGGDKPALLLLHGWGCKGETYRKLIDGLSSRFRVIAPDLPGFGQTPEPPEPWGVGGYADFVKSFCKSLKVQNPALFGHSLGCRIIIKLIAEHDFSCGKIVLTGAAGVKPAKSPAQKCRTAFFKLGKVFLAPFPKLLEKARSRSGSADYRAASPRMRQCLVKIVNEDLTPLLSRVNREVLLIWGENDDSTPLADGQLMEQKMPNAGLAVIKNAGHYAFFDQPEQFNRILDSYFLKQGDEE
jgi:pimeloyl-ACP methyl ester carboxylesterase